MIDTHCHLDVTGFDGDREQVLARAWAAGLTGLVIPAIGPEAWEPLRAWAARDPRVKVGLGIHPQLLPHLDPHDDDRLLTSLDEALARGGASAVGECGLDGPSAAQAPLDRQVAILAAHQALADKHGLPLLVHCLRAHPALRAFLTRHPPPRAGLLLHSYSGSAELTPFYLEAGCHFSFAGPVTFPEAHRPLAALRAIPAGRLMAETDAPDQSPHPHRGQRNEPAHLPLVVEAMSRARGEPGLGAALTQNARRFFGWP